MSATISYNGFALRRGSPHARKHSMILASTLIQCVRGNDDPLNSAAIVGVSLAPLADLLKSVFAPRRVRDATRHARARRRGDIAHKTLRRRGSQSQRSRTDWWFDRSAEARPQADPWPADGRKRPLRPFLDGVAASHNGKGQRTPKMDACCCLVREQQRGAVRTKEERVRIALVTRDRGVAVSAVRAPDSAVASRASGIGASRSGGWFRSGPPVSAGRRASGTSR
jgi:hypothetical protein